MLKLLLHFRVGCGVWLLIEGMVLTLGKGHGQYLSSHFWQLGGWSDIALMDM